MSEEKKNEILQEKLDAEELEAVSGGANFRSDNAKHDGPGGCSSNYYKQKCSATVEEGSHCWRDDFCFHWSENYTELK